jgi:LmbE family N-acetylglucosaminyl deacetylase
MKQSKWAVLLLGAVVCAVSNAQTPKTAPALPKADDRYKTDVLVIVAHPDDDTGITNYLFPAVFDEHKRVAVAFTTRGNSGGNAIGMEQSKALVDERELEARKSLALGGITNVWFLRGSDTPTQDVLHSLETLGHGEALEEMVRLVRLTRPQVIITWLPAYVAGENHGDHQASGVVATQAFDLAGDPTAFPSQVSAPRKYGGISNYGEGLHPWQAKKLYYISDASHPEFLEHHGPKYLATGKLRSNGASIADLNAKSWAEYATQTETPALMDYYIHMPDYLVLGKSLVKSPVEADVWDGIDPTPAVFNPIPGYKPATRPAVSLELGGPWSFYQEFYRVHDLPALPNLVKPQAAYGGDQALWVPLLLHNDSAEAKDLRLRSSLPQGWTPVSGETIYHVEPHSTYPAQLLLNGPPKDEKAPPQQLTWSLEDNGKSLGQVSLMVYLEYNGVPQ